MSRATLHGFGLGLMVWLGWLIPFHRLPLPEHYAPSALTLALLLCVMARPGVFGLAAMLAGAALLAVSLGAADPTAAQWLGPWMVVSALAALIHRTFGETSLVRQRIAHLLRDLAAGCALAVAMLAIFLPLARLRMPILTAFAMLVAAAIAQGFARRARR